MVTEQVELSAEEREVLVLVKLFEVFAERYPEKALLIEGRDTLGRPTGFGIERVVEGGEAFVQFNLQCPPEAAEVFESLDAKVGE